MLLKNGEVRLFYEGVSYVRAGHGEQGGDQPLGAVETAPQHVIQTPLLFHEGAKVHEHGAGELAAVVTARAIDQAGGVFGTDTDDFSGGEFFADIGGVDDGEGDKVIALIVVVQGLELNHEVLLRALRIGNGFNEGGTRGVGGAD